MLYSFNEKLFVKMRKISRAFRSAECWSSQSSSYKQWSKVNSSSAKFPIVKSAVNCNHVDLVNHHLISSAVRVWWPYAELVDVPLIDGSQINCLQNKSTVSWAHADLVLRLHERLENLHRKLVFCIFGCRCVRGGKGAKKKNEKK